MDAANTAAKGRVALALAGGMAGGGCSKLLVSLTNARIKQVGEAVFCWKAHTATGEWNGSEVCRFVEAGLCFVVCFVSSDGLDCSIDAPLLARLRTLVDAPVYVRLDALVITLGEVTETGDSGQVTTEARAAGDYVKFVCGGGGMFGYCLTTICSVY